MGIHAPRVLPKRLKKSGWTIAIVSGILYIAGNIWLYCNMREMFFDEVRLRSLALTQQHLWFVAHSLEQHEVVLLRLVSEELMKQPGVRYLVIVDPQNHILFSKSIFLEDNFTLPEEFRSIPCSNNGIKIKNSTLFGDDILRIEASIRTESSTSDCVGGLYIGISLENAKRRLWSLLPISFGISSILFAGIIICVILISYQIAQFIQRRTHALHEMVPQSFLENQTAVATFQAETLLEEATRQIATSRAQFRERLQLMSSQIYQAANELAKTAEIQAGSNQHHAHLTLQYSLLMRERLKILSQQVADAHQTDDLAASTLVSMQAIDSAVDQLANGLVEMRESVDGNIERVKALNDKIRSIRNAVKAITSIADLTKLIAFNASIEAAGAGKSGGRFSIVATEVRRLANTVVDSVEEIDSLVSAIEVAAADLQLSSETGQHKVAEEDTSLHELRELLYHAKELLQHTSSSAQDVVSSIQKTSEGKEQLTADMQTLSQEAEQIAHNHSRLFETIKELTALIAECKMDTQESA